MTQLTYLEAAVVGLVQGVSEGGLGKSHGRKKASRCSTS
jgi:hypothetical protein